MGTVGEGAGARAQTHLPSLVYKESLCGWKLSRGPGSGQSSQDITDGAPIGVTVHLVYRAGRLSPNTCQGITPCSAEQAGPQAQHACVYAQTCTHMREALRAGVCAASWA